MPTRVMVLRVLVTVLSASGCGADRDVRRPRVKGLELTATDSGDPDSNQDALPLRSIDFVDRLLRQRLIDDPTFTLARYLDNQDKEATGQTAALSDFLRPATGNGQTAGKQLTPDPMNQYVWYMALHSFGEHVAASCCKRDESDRSRTTAAPLNFKREAGIVLARLCQHELMDADLTTDAGHFPMASLQARLINAWDLMLEEDGTEPDKIHWMQFNVGNTERFQGREFIHQAVLTALYNHDFLTGK